MIFIIIWQDDDLKKIKKRDPHLFDKVYTEYKNKIFTFLVIKTNGDKDIAEEVLCETFHSAIISAPNIKDLNSIGSWLVKIASRRLNDHFRKKYREKKYAEKVGVNEVVNDDLADELHKKEEILLVKTAMNGLKEKYRKILKLKYIEQKTQKEIAGILNLSDAVVNSLLQRARESLRNEFKKIVKDF